MTDALNENEKYMGAQSVQDHAERKWRISCNRKLVLMVTQDIDASLTILAGQDMTRESWG